MTRGDATTPEDERAASVDEEALADAGLPQEGAQPAAAPARRRGLSGLGHRLYNGEAGLDV